MLDRILNNRFKKNLQKGFTIIEVMIVLAIAGLILVVVLIAVPQLQRNQRNEARRSILARISTEVSNYSGNNNGQLPKADTTSGDKAFGTPLSSAGFFTRYLKCSSTAGVANCEININDPRTGFPVGTGENGNSNKVAFMTNALGDGEGDLYYGTGYVCDGELPTSTGATSRNFAIAIRFEGGASYCLDNQ